MKNVSAALGVGFGLVQGIVNDKYVTEMLQLNEC
jgi:hypothetical protein